MAGKTGRKIDFRGRLARGWKRLRVWQKSRALNIEIGHAKTALEHVAEARSKEFEKAKRLFAVGKSNKATAAMMMTDDFHQEVISAQERIAKLKAEQNAIKEELKK